MTADQYVMAVCLFAGGMVAGMYLLPVPEEKMPQTVCGQKVGSAWLCTEV